MANRTMLSRLTLQPEQIHRMRGEDEPAQAAAEYDQELRSAFRLNEPGDLPLFNLLLLGLGENAHIASLFPHHPALHENSSLTVAVDVDALPRRRISLTMPVINNAERVMFLVSGEKKAPAVKSVLQGANEPEQYPAQFVRPHRGEVLWLIDKAAASQLG
jgi:6-phosphogluconolactonase